jgi:hypothetical protein
MIFSEQDRKTLERIWEHLRDAPAPKLAPLSTVHQVLNELGVAIGRIEAAHTKTADLVAQGFEADAVWMNKLNELGLAVGRIEAGLKASAELYGARMAEIDKNKGVVDESIARGKRIEAKLDKLAEAYALGRDSAIVQLSEAQASGSQNFAALAERLGSIEQRLTKNSLVQGDALLTGDKVARWATGHKQRPAKRPAKKRRVA